MSSAFFSDDQAMLKMDLRSVAFILRQETAMPRTKQSSLENFGRRLALLRKSRGMSQRDLAAKLEISPRMMAYYEAQTDRPPVQLLGQLSQLLDCSIDELLGFVPIKTKAEQPLFSPHFWRKLQRVAELSPTDRRAVIQYIDMLIMRQKQQHHALKGAR